MNKAESTSSQVLNGAEHADSNTSLWTDFKALIKTGIINSNLLTAFGGFWLALYMTNEQFVHHIPTFIYMMLGSGLVIAGGCVINNYYDRDIDHVMKRTKKRPTVTGTIPLSVVLTMGIGFTVLGVGFLFLTTWQAAAIGIFGWFAYVILYTMWSKRRYTINTAIGSFSGAVPPLIGYAAIDGGLSTEAWIVFAIMFIWQTPHFLALAMKKAEDYKAANIPMLPSVYGFGITKRQIIVYTVCLLPLPFYLTTLGTVFVAIATVLNVGWLAIGIAGFFMKDDLKWANWMFIYSLNYLMIFFIALVVFTTPAIF
ncbi:heme o synthase [Terribacillus halophilus]|uniref:heme o synthase n=1 Tax=Terribacillus halophilus TaxID=361279 RepID=UPI00098532D2